MKKLSKADLFWKNHIKQFQLSELSQVDYCRMHNLNAKSFSARKSKFQREHREYQVESNKQNFIPINEKNELFKIKLSSGLELSFDKTPDPLWLASILKSIGTEHDQY